MYTQQHTAGFTENNWFPHILRPTHPIGTLGVVAALCQENPDMMYPLLEHCINLDNSHVRAAGTFLHIIGTFAMETKSNYLFCCKVIFSLRPHV